METTNEVLTRVLTDLENLVSWADADTEHSEESDAPEQAATDRARAQLYRAAHQVLATAFKS